MNLVKPGMSGVFGKTHIELDSFIDLKKFDDLHLDISSGLAIADKFSKCGSLKNPIDHKDMSYDITFKPLSDAYKEYQQLQDDSCVKIQGEYLRKNFDNKTFSLFLKYFYEAYDTYALYNLWVSPPGWKKTRPERNLTEEAKYFPSLISWIDNLINNNVFSYVGRVYILTQQGGGVSLEHRDPLSDSESFLTDEFIHIKSNINRPYYLYNPVEKKKYYIKSRASWWNSTDIHGGDSVLYTSYAIRIDGLFTDDFKNKILSVK